MARSKIIDFLLTNRYHVLDVSFTFPPVFIPIFGFQSISCPEINVQFREIKEGNYEFPRKVVERASVSSITFYAGSQLFNSDMWDWINKAPEGTTVKKNLLLIHFTSMAGAQAEALGGFVEFDFRIPGKGWLLRNCAPARYKGGSDFDAMSGSVSIQELEVEYEELIEFNCGIG